MFKKITYGMIRHKEEVMKRNYFLDILKGICIILIIVTHFEFSESDRLSYFFPYWISMAVPIFMIISGYVYAMSYERHGIIHMEQAYDLFFVMKKVIRYSVPFFIAYLIEVVIWLITDPSMQLMDYVYYLVRGGIGPGSYYYPMMLQFIFLYPLIHFTIKKYNFKGLVICGVLNVFYEFVQWGFGFNSDTYRMLIFRFLLVIAFGAYLYLRKEKLPSYVYWIAFVGGLLLTYLISYHNKEFVCITQWKRTSFLACVFLLPVMDVLISKCHRLRIQPLEILGKASFDIFLVQMIYYHFFGDVVYAMMPNDAVGLLLNCIICFGIGVPLYYLETPLTKRMTSYLKKQNKG